MKAPGPNCPALAIWKPEDVGVLASVDWEQHKAEDGGSVAPSWLCRVQRAPELCTAQQVWCGGFVQPSYLQRTSCRGQQRSSCLLVPPAFLAVQHGAHLLPLCCWSVIPFFLGLATLLVGTAFGKNQPEQERNSNAQSKIFAVRNPRGVLCHQDVSWDVW